MVFLCISYLNFSFYIVKIIFRNISTYLICIFLASFGIVEEWNTRFFKSWHTTTFTVVLSLTDKYCIEVNTKVKQKPQTQGKCLSPGLEIEK